MNIKDGVTTLVAIAVVFGAGYFFGSRSCEDKTITVVPPAVRVPPDTVEVPPKWALDLIAQQNQMLAKKPRLDTQYIAREVLVKDSFPYPIFAKDTSSRFWWPERATFGDKPGVVSTVVTREPFSGKATVLQYQTPGPVMSFVADTSPRPNITFGKWVVPKEHHGILTDILYITGSLGAGYFTGSTWGCRGKG